MDISELKHKAIALDGLAGKDALWLISEVERFNAELEAAIVEVGQLKQSLWPMKDREIARWKDAYENMRDFAVKSGLDTTCYGPESV